MTGAFKYRAFISYSHRDKAWGDWLHKALETYRVPKRLVGTVERDGPVPARLFPIFRDREELPSSSDLNEQINVALERSAYLIVICSPHGATSRWVNEEILTFKRLGRANRILALIVNGEPNASDKAYAEGQEVPLECFPIALKFKLDADGELSSERTEVVAADARPHADGRENAKVKLIAGLLGVGYDALKQRDLESARRRARFYQAIAASMALLAVLAAAAAWFAFEQRQEARYQRDQVVQAQSRLLTEAAAERLKNRDVSGAQSIILEVLANTHSSEAINVFQNTRAADMELAVLCDHDSFVESAVYSPDGRRIVTASYDKTARIWDATTGKQLAVLSGHDNAVESAVYSPDGRSIVTASDDKTARIWDATRGKQLAVLSGHKDTVNFAAYSPDGRRIVTASDDMTVRIWGASGKQLMVLFGHGGAISTAAYSPDGRHIVTTSDDKTARIWDAASGKQLVVFSGHEDPVNFAAYSSDGRRIVTASNDKSARIWDASSGMQLSVLSGHENRVNTATYSPDGRRIVTASDDKTARIWDAANGKQIVVLAGHDNTVDTAAYSPDGRHLVTASHDKTARIWDAASGKQLVVLAGHDGHVESAVYSPDGRRIVTASYDKTARIWDATTGKQLAVLSGHDYLVNSAAFSPDGQRIVTASNDATARIWDASSGKQLAVLSGHGYLVNSAAFSPDGRRIVTASNDKTARIWDAASGKQVSVLSGHDNVVGTAAYSPDGRRIVTASDDKTARIWDAASGKQLVVLSGHDGHVESATYSPDGRHIVTASNDKTARIWDAADGKQLSVLSGHEDLVNSAAYSPDGRRIVTASHDKTARIWDAQIPADLDSQIVWEKAGEFDPLTDVERGQLGLPHDAQVRTWPDNASKCDSVSGADYDPDRLAPGVVQAEISADVANTACAREIAKSGNTSRLVYQLGRALLAKHDAKGAKREFELAVSQGYRAAQIDLANLLVDTSARTLDPARAVLLYEKAWQDGVPVAAFELGRLCEYGVQGMDATAHVVLRPDSAKAWFWYRKGADTDEPNALARFGDKDDRAAIAAVRLKRRDAILLDAFRYYAAAAELAHDEDWPDVAWKQWRYRRATLARLLARDGMMQQVADAYTAIREKYRPRKPSLLQRLAAAVGL